MIFKGYTKRDTLIIKGFGILCIVLHNYFHWLDPSPGENEFTFSSGRVSDFFSLLAEEPEEFANVLFSYLGHYGVQLFIFVSGFGLAVSMMNRQRTWESFVLTRLKKLYPLLLVGILFLILGNIVMTGEMLGDSVKTQLGYKLFFIHTLIPNAGLSVNGPWWFFGLIFQLYLLFPYIFRWIERWRWKAFLVLCVVAYALVFLFRYVFTLNGGAIIMQNAPGHLPEFCLGILLAFCKDRKISVSWLIGAVVVFVLGNYYAVFYPLTFITLTVMMVFAYQWLKSIRVNKAFVSSGLAHFGEISMALFVVHACFREPVLDVASTAHGPWGHFISGIVFLLIVWGVAIPAKALYDFVCLQLNKIQIRENRVTHIIGVASQVAIGCFFVLVFGYFIAQNINKYDKSLDLIGKVTKAGALIENKEYLQLVDIPIDEKILSCCIKGSFDVVDVDKISDMPLLVLDIPGVVWNKVPVHSDGDYSLSNRYDFEYIFQCPFNKFYEKKQVKIYFWNKKKCAMTFENASFSIMY